MSDTKCPCKECPVIPICRHKPFTVIFRQCSLLLKYEPSFFLVENRKESRIEAISNTLKPTVWEYRLMRKYKGQYYRLVTIIPRQTHV